MLRRMVECGKILDSAYLTSTLSTVAEVYGISTTLMGFRGVPPSAQVYQLTLDEFQKLSPKKQKALLEGGYDLRTWLLQGAKMMDPAFYIVIWTSDENGSATTHYVPLSDILTPEERAAHAAYSCQFLGGTQRDALYDEESLPEVDDLIRANMTTKMLDDGMNYCEVPVLAIPRLRISDMLRKGWRVRFIEGVLYWTKKSYQ